jgi:hypothetical protein
MRGIAVSFAELNCRPWRDDRNAPPRVRDDRPDLSGVRVVVTQVNSRPAGRPELGSERGDAQRWPHRQHRGDLPDLRRGGKRHVLAGIAVPVRDAHGFILVKDGTEPIAVTDSHGTWLEWLA